MTPGNPFLVPFPLVLGRLDKWNCGPPNHPAPYSRGNLLTKILKTHTSTKRTGAKLAPPLEASSLHLLLAAGAPVVDCCWLGHKPALPLLGTSQAWSSLLATTARFMVPILTPANLKWPPGWHHDESAKLKPTLNLLHSGGSPSRTHRSFTRAWGRLERRSSLGRRAQAIRLTSVAVWLATKMSPYLDTGWIQFGGVAGIYPPKGKGQLASHFA